MKPITHWIGQYLIAASTMFGLLVAIEVSGGAAFADAWAEALTWAATAAAVFVGSRWWQARRNARCAICKDDTTS